MRSSRAQTTLHSLLAMTLGALSLTTAIAPFLKHNTTPSVPLGWYAIVPLMPIEVSNFEVGCMPLSAAEFVRRHHLAISTGACPGDIAPIIKRVLATAPSSVRLTPEGITVNNVLTPNTKPLTMLHDGTPLPTPPPHRLVENETFVVGDHSRSFDSRYWGPLPHGIRALALLQQQ